MENFKSEDFLVTNQVKLDETPTRWDAEASKKEKKKALKKVGKKLSKMQDIMYAQNK